MVQNTSRVFIKLFCQSVPAPFEKHLACKSEELLNTKASIGYFTSESIVYIINRLNFYEDYPDFMYIFLNVIQEISAFEDLAEILMEQGAVSIIMDWMSQLVDDEQIQLTALKTVENLKGAGFEGMMFFFQF